MHILGSTQKFSFPGQQDLKHSGTELPVLVMSLVTFCLKFNRTFKFGGTGIESMHMGPPGRSRLLLPCHPTVSQSAQVVSIPVSGSDFPSCP